MGILVDQTNVGETGSDASDSTIVVTTTAAVVAGALIVGTICWLDTAGSPTLSSVSGGGLTWTIDKQVVGGGSTTASLAIVSAQAPSGLASGATITANLSGSSPGARSFALTSFTGALTSGVAGATSGPTDFTAATAWTTASTAISAGSMLVAISAQLTSNYSSTITGPSVETHDIDVGPAQFSATSGYRISTTAASVTVAGTWSSAATGTVCAVEYKAASGRTKPTYPATPIASATTSVTLPSHAIGDLLVIGAYNNAATTVPTTPSAGGTVPTWATLDGPTGANVNALKVSTVVATAANHTSGTWTNATHMVAVVIRGIAAASPTTTGHAQGGSAAANSCQAPGTTLTVTDGTSLACSIIFHKTVTAWGTTPAGQTQQLASTTGLVVVLDMTTTTSSPGAITQNDTAVSGGYRGETFEVLGLVSTAAPIRVVATAVHRSNSW